MSYRYRLAFLDCIGFCCNGVNILAYYLHFNIDIEFMEYFILCNIFCFLCSLKFVYGKHNFLSYHKLIRIFLVVASVRHLFICNNIKSFRKNHFEKGGRRVVAQGLQAC